MNKKHKGKFFIVMGLLMMGVALLLTCYNVWDEKRAEAVGMVVLNELEFKVANSTEDIVDYEFFPDVLMPTEEVEGEEYIGILDIPVLELSLPVISEWSYPRLRIAPCRYEGSAYTKDLIIAAHNYDCHFGTLKSLALGDVLTFTDMAGNCFEYEVAEMEILDGTAVRELEQGEWDLTLFTCTLGGTNRVVIRCVEIEG